MPAVCVSGVQLEERWEDRARLTLWCCWEQRWYECYLQSSSLLSQLCCLLSDTQLL